jgi:hypothetical protein
MDNTRATIVTHVATIGVFKLVTSILVLYYFPSWHAVSVILAVSVPWIVAGVWYFGLYTRIRVRLVRGRMRRRALMHQEWHVD